jgi:hypothetical protein
MLDYIILKEDIVVSKIENNLVNICYLANYETFKKAQVCRRLSIKCGTSNKFRKNFKNAVIQFEKPLTISQVSSKKKNV